MKKDKFVSACIKLVPWLIMLLYFANNQADTKKGEEELYNNVPDIKVYSSNTLLKDDLLIIGRTPSQILGSLTHPIEGDRRNMKKYYEVNLEQQGWSEVNYDQIKDDHVHYGDRFVFEKGIYRIALDIHPPLENKLSDLDMKFYLKNKKPYYNIYFGKKNVVFKEWKSKNN